MNKIRNVAIIAHVDHGKTTLVDQLLKQAGALKAKTVQEAGNHLIMDSNELECERGITILAKNTAILWQDYHINIVDTPGHADFGGEVERILSMVDSVLLLVDAVDGPMPQTRFVTEKAFAAGLKPIVVINKIDRPHARPEWVINRVFDLFDQLGATEQQLDFPVIYTSALQGYATLDYNVPSHNMDPLFQLIVDLVPPPTVEKDAPLQMQISSLDYSSFVGTIGIGRVTRGTIKRNQNIMIINREGQTRPGKVSQILKFTGLSRYEVAEAVAGDIVALTGLEGIQISDTLCDPQQVVALPALTIDEPTISMIFEVNSSPFAGQEGKFLTSRHLRERLYRELTHNVALRVEDTEFPDKFKVSGRGELHLGVLIETMRREGYELAVSRPQVILKNNQGKIEEPYERLVIEIDEPYQGKIIESLGRRKGELITLENDWGEKGRLRLEYLIPTRGLLGFQNEFINLTSGTGIMSHVFERYDTLKNESAPHRNKGVMVSAETGKTTGYALFNLQERGAMLVSPQTEVYEGMIVGINARNEDMVVNPTKEKHLTNIRAAGSDENIILTPPVIMSLEKAFEFIEDDELIEITPSNLRLRKKLLKALDRRRQQS